MRLKNLAVSLMAASLLTSITSEASQIVNKIIVDGNQRVEASTIENYLDVHPGENFTDAKQKSAVRNLFKTSLFDEIKVRYDSGIVHVHVHETPLVIKIQIKGNSKISSKNINKEIMTKVGSSLRESDLEYDKNKIIEMYKRSGRFAVKVKPEIKKLANNRVTVTFKVIEGPKTAVKVIRFVGNDHYTGNELKSILATKEKAWYRFLESSDTYDPDRIEHDKTRLKYFYESLGYADFKVLSANAELSPSKDYFIVTYAIDEGQKYKFGKITLENNLKDIKTQYLKKRIKTIKGRTFNGSSIELTEDTIIDWLSSIGYQQVDIDHVMEKDLSTKTVNITYVVNKAAPAYVNKINIRGNLKTHEKVIRREFKMAEGDLVNRSQINRAQRSLRNLDFFEKVIVDPKQLPDTQGKYDINVDVQEKSTSSVGIDVGYSTASGPFTKLSYDDRNVLGTGKDFNTAVQFARKSSSYSVGLTEPHFLDKNLSLGGSLFYNHSGSGHINQFWGEQNPYTLDTIGGRINTGYELANDLSHNIFYTLKQDKLTVPQNQIALFLLEARGKRTTSSIGHSFTWDKTDNIYMPKKGYVITAMQEYAGLGGQNHYLKHDITATSYSSFVDNKYTLKISGSIGDIRGMHGHTVLVNDRFNLGDQSMRGFASNGIGPRDKRTGEALGGKKYYSATAELQFPIGMPQEFGLFGALFTDVGGLYDFDIKKNVKYYTKQDINDSKAPRVSYGLGLIWNTRIAPIRVDYAFRLRKQKYDDVQPWHIRFSTHF